MAAFVEQRSAARDSQGPLTSITRRPTDLQGSSERAFPVVTLVPVNVEGQRFTYDGTEDVPQENLWGVRSGLVSLRRHSARTPGLPKAAAHDVAWKRNPLLDEEPREDVERTSEGFGWRRLCLVA